MSMCLRIELYKALNTRSIYVHVCALQNRLCGAFFWNSMSMTYFTIKFCSCGIHSRWACMWNAACSHHVHYNMQSPEGTTRQRDVWYLRTVGEAPHNYSASAALNCRGYGRVTVHWYNRNLSQRGRERQEAAENYTKAIPLQAWTGPEGSWKLKLPDFKTIDTRRC
jgi:hypothetical protein